jgi:hypothetical protein
MSKTNTTRKTVKPSDTPPRGDTDWARVDAMTEDDFAHVSDYVEYPGQGHWVLGQPGWEQVADDTAAWLDGKTA